MLKFLLSCWMFFLPIASYAAEYSAVQDQLNQILAKYQGKVQVSVAVQSLSNGSMVYQKNAALPLIPASSLKILTAYAALRQLGPEYTYKTQLLTDAMGNLYVRFDGDPDLTTEELDSLFAKARATGLKTVTGNVIIDDGHYDSQGIAPGTVYSDKSYCYGVPIDAMNLNRNCISLTVRPGNKVGQRAQVSFMDNIPLPMENTVTTGGGKKKCGVRLRYNEEVGQYQLSGCIRQKGKPIHLRVVVNNKQYGRSAVTTLLKRNQIVLKGGVKKSRTPASATILATHESEPVKTLVHTMLKKSDNLIANALFKKVGASYFSQPGSWDYGSKAVRAILGNNQASMSVHDGSGLSRFNQVSSVQLLQVLKQAWYDTDISNYFFDGLPASGIKGGTLKRRMGTPDMIGKVKAKTGTMKGVTALAGYIETQNREILAFSIIVNGFTGPASPYRKLEDQICHVLRTV